MFKIWKTFDLEKGEKCDKKLEIENVLLEKELLIFKACKKSRPNVYAGFSTNSTLFVRRRSVKTGIYLIVCKLFSSETTVSIKKKERVIFWCSRTNCDVKRKKMSTKIDFQLNPDNRLDTKWLKTDLEEALKKNQILHYWNELLKDGELVVNGYCTSKTSTPDSGNDLSKPLALKMNYKETNLPLNLAESCVLINCNNAGINAKQRKAKSDLSDILQGNTPSQKLIDSWTWNKNNGTSHSS